MTTVRVGSATDVGMVRTNNEDQLLVSDRLFAVADGMGGHQAGEVASQTALDGLAAAFPEPATPEDLVAAVEAANRAVTEGASARGLQGMGTTLTACAMVVGADGGEALAIVNVGDSRAYLFRDNSLQQLTDDHNVPGELLKRGEITAAEAAVHPQRNRVTRWLGDEGGVEVDLWEVAPFTGDRVLLASDGLFGEVDDETIERVLRSQPDPQKAADQLVRLAKNAGGSDNITVVLVDVADDGGKSSKASKAIPAPPVDFDEDASPTAQTPQARADELPAQAASGATSGAGPKPEARRRAVTPRVAVFLLALVLLLGAALGLVLWYGRSTYYVGTSGDVVAVYRGRPNGFLWLDPSLDQTTDVRVADLPEVQRDQVRAGKTQPSRTAANRYIDNLTDLTTTTTTATTTTTTTTAPAPTATTRA